MSEHRETILQRGEEHQQAAAEGQLMRRQTIASPSGHAPEPEALVQLRVTETLELARLIQSCETWPYTGLDNLEVDFVNGFVLDTLKLDRFEHGPGNHLCSVLDKIQLDENTLFFRLCDESEPSWKSIMYCCKLASLSQTFYRCISVEQWLRTVIQRQSTHSHVIEIHSNVVPRLAYLTKLQGMQASCLGHQCIGGFFPTSVGSLTPCQSCASCSLAAELVGVAHTDSTRGGFWELAKADVRAVDDHAPLGQGSDGEVSKVIWRKGVFAMKRFSCENPERDNLSLTRELDVALSVSHPNLVHFFGCSRWTPDCGDHCDLFMELMEEDLERLLEKGARLGDTLSFRDLLGVLLQIAEAMRHLHEQNFVHGDLKPGNILVSRLAMPHTDAQFYLVKVADFGRTQRVGSSQVFDFEIGTPYYTAPEVWRCRRSEAWKRHKKYGEAAPPPPEQPQKIDVYSFGVVAYQVVTGVTKLYRGRDKSLNIAEEIIEGRMRPDFNFDGNLDGERLSLLPLIWSCWISNPDERPSFSQICVGLNRRLVVTSEFGERW